MSDERKDTYEDDFDEVDVHDLVGIRRTLHQAREALYSILQEDKEIAQYIPTTASIPVPREIYEYVNNVYVDHYINYRDHGFSFPPDELKHITEAIVLANTGLVMKMCSKYTYDSVLEVEDLFNSSILGVYDALEDFDPKKARANGNKFATYLTWKIRGRLTAASSTQRNTGPVLSNPGAIERYSKARRAVQTAIEQGGDPLEYIADALNLERDWAIRDWYRVVVGEIRLDQLVSDVEENPEEYVAAFSHPDIYTLDYDTVLKAIENAIRIVQEGINDESIISRAIVDRAIYLYYISGADYTQAEVTSIISKSNPSRSITTEALQHKYYLFKKVLKAELVKLNYEF